MHKRISWLFQFSEFSCSSIFILKRYIKIQKSRNPPPPCFFTYNKYFWSKNETYNKKNHDISYIREREKLILRKKFVKIILAVIIAVNYFCKTFHLDIWQGSEYVSGFEYIRVLNMPRLCRVVNMSEYVWIIPEYNWLSLNMPEHIWTCQSMPKSARISLLYVSPL